MKNLATLLVFALSLNVAIVSANELGPKKAYAATITEIGSLLSPSTPVGYLASDVVVKVTICINQNREIIVLSTDTDNAELASYIKNNLNAVRLNSNELVQGEKYAFGVKFKAE